MTQPAPTVRAKKNRSLLHSTFLVSCVTSTSRVTGFVREMVFAYFFGASPGFEAFLVAFRIPNFLRRLFAEGAFSQAFVPILSEYRQQRSEDEVRIFLNRMAGSLTAMMFVITAIAVVIAPVFVWIFAPGFIHDPTRYELAQVMLRITFPYLLFISLTAYVSGILNSYGEFGIPAFTPNLLNFALIAAAIFLAPHFKQPAEALAWGVFIGGVAQLLFQLPFLYRLKLFPHLQLCWQDPGVRRVVKLMVPAIFGVSVAQISFLVDLQFASFLRQGSVAWLYFADRLTSFPLGVFGVAIATVVLPHLSRKFAAKSTEEYSATIDWAMRFVLVIALPATLGIMLLGYPILTTVYQHGKFNLFDVTMAYRSLLAFAVGIPPIMLVKVLASGFYSRQDIRTPVKIAVISVLANVALDALLIYPLAHAGLALATSLSSALNAGLLFYILRKRAVYVAGTGWRIFWLRLLLASGLMAVFLFFVTSDLQQWMAWGIVSRALHLAILCFIAIVIYLGSLWCSGMRWRDFMLKE